MLDTIANKIDEFPALVTKGWQVNKLNTSAAVICAICVILDIINAVVQFIVGNFFFGLSQAILAAVMGAFWYLNCVIVEKDLEQSKGDKNG